MACFVAAVYDRRGAIFGGHRRTATIVGVGMWTIRGRGAGWLFDIQCKTVNVNWTVPKRVFFGDVAAVCERIDGR